MPDDVVFFSKGRVGLAIRVRPGARVTAVVGVKGDRLVIDVAAQPEKGKANKELIRFLAKSLGLRKNQVVIVSGETGRKKNVVFLDDGQDSGGRTGRKKNITQDTLRSAFGLTDG